MSLGPLNPIWSWGFAAALIGAATLVTWSWRRLAATGPLRVLGRLASLTCIAVLALLAAAFPLNRTFQWYGSWGSIRQSLSGEAGASVEATHTGSTAGDATATHYPSPFAKTAATEPRDVRLAPQPYGAGHVQTFQVDGSVSGHSGEVLVWFPPSYPLQNQARTPDFPVIEAFHGYPSTPETILSSFHLDQAITDLSHGGKMREAVVVMPNWAPNGRDTECVDGRPAGPQMETWLMRDVPDWIHRNLRVSSDRQSWATFGYSAGGWCALMGSTLRPDLFASAISLSGYARPSFSADYQPFAGANLQGRRYDLVRSAGARPPAIAIWALTADEDTLSYPTTVALDAVTRSPMSFTMTVLGKGDHRVEAWIPYVTPALEWLGAHAQGFARG